MTDREHLRALLHAHRPADAEEAQHRERMLALTATPACFERDHFAPGHFTASAFVIAPDRRHTLLIFHSKLSRWLQPGGHVEPQRDANIIEAARREIAEEVGLDSLPLLLPGIFDVDIHMIPARKSDPAHEHFDVRVAFLAPDLHFRAGDDALSARWVALDDVHEDTSDRSVMRAVDKLKA